jgi:hypothetical protein
MKRPSPFLYGNPIPATLFTGRRRELADVLDRLLHHGQSTAVVGEPRTGKTSLLEYLASPEALDDLRQGDREHILVVYIDSHTLDHGLDDATFWERVFEPLDDSESPLPPGSPARAALRACRESGFQVRRIRALLSSLHAAGARIALLVDEFDYLVQHCVTDPRSFFGSLRSLTTLSRGALALVLASRRSLAFLDDVAQGAGYSGSPYFNFVAEQILGPLSRAEVDSIVLRAGDRFSLDDREFVHDLAGGHPYLVQLCADALFRAQDDGGSNPAARRQAAGARALREASRVLADIWRHWSPAQRFVVTSLTVAGRADVARFPVDVEPLVAQGFIVRTGADLRIASRLLQTWCLGELQARSRSGDPLRDWIEQGEGDLPLSLAEKQAWTGEVLAVFTGVVPERDAGPLRRAARQRCLKVFFSYAHEDHRYRDRLDQHLAALKWEGSIETWHDQRIVAGTDWREATAGKLDEADVILLLISADFLASDFCVDVQMEQAIARHRQGAAHVVPIPVRPADWGAMPFASLQPLPRSRRPIASLEDQDAAWKEVAEGIRELVARTQKVAR